MLIKRLAENAPLESALYPELGLLQPFKMKILFPVIFTWILSLFGMFVTYRPSKTTWVGAGTAGTSGLTVGGETGTTGVTIGVV